MNTVDVLKGARELLSDPERWTQGAFSRDAEGNSLIGWGSLDATCYCLRGALYKAGGGSAPADPAVDALDPCLPAHLVKAARDNGSSSVVEFNDAPDRTHAEVLGVLDCAIAKASA